MKNYAAYGPVLWIALLVLCILLTYLTVCTVKYYQVRSEVDRLNADVDALSVEIEAQKVSAKQRSELFHEVMSRVLTLRKENTRLNAEISEMKTESKRFDKKTATDDELLAQLLAAEAGPGSTYEECRAIAQVVMNRWDIAPFPQSLLNTLTEPGQFSPVTSGAWLFATPNRVETAAAYNALHRIDDAGLAKDVLYFVANGHEDSFFHKLSLYDTIGDTSFYRAP
jgi:spore germination cell wall hydrolase CwlJ-like protein